MNGEQTLSVFERLAYDALFSLNHDRHQITAGDAANGKYFRTYNQREACDATGLNHRQILKVIEQLDIDAFDGRKFCVDIRDVEAIRQHVHKKNRRPRTQDNQAVVIAVSNLKGGTGKTTVTTTFSTGLCSETLHQYKVLVIDLDPQGTSSMYLKPNLSDDDFTIGDLLMGNYALDHNETFTDVALQSCYATNTPDLFVMPIRPSDRNYEIISKKKQNEAESNQTEFVVYEDLKRVIDALKDDFDVIFLDTPPNFGSLTISAHYVANNIIVPVLPSQNDRDSTSKYFDFLVEAYKVIQLLGHQGYRFVNVLPTAVDIRSNAQTSIANKVRIASTNNCFSVDFLESEAIKNCAEKQNTIFDQSASEYDATKSSLKNIQNATRTLVYALESQINQIWKEELQDGKAS
jgi:chromosome partitioning protein